MSSWSIEIIFIIQLKMKTLLVLDNAITHKTCKVNDKIKKCKTSISIIPSGLTRRMYLLNISI